MCLRDVDDASVNTLFLLRVADGRFHAVEGKPVNGAKDEAVTLPIDTTQPTKAVVADEQLDNVGSSCMETRSKKKSRLM